VRVFNPLSAAVELTSKLQPGAVHVEDGT